MNNAFVLCFHACIAYKAFCIQEWLNGCSGLYCSPKGFSEFTNGESPLMPIADVKLCIKIPLNMFHEDCALLNALFLLLNGTLQILVGPQILNMSFLIA